MRIIEQKIYKYNELNADVKKKLLEEQREAEYDWFLDFGLLDCMENEAEELVKEYFGENAKFIKTNYDLSYSQGSGAMIWFNVDFEDLNNKYHILNDEEMRFVKDKGCISEIEVHHDYSHYDHEYCFDVLWDYDYSWNYEDIKGIYKISEDDFNKIEDKIINLLVSNNKHQTESEFIKDIIKMNKDLKDRGYEIIEAPVDDDVCIEQLEEHEYYEDGRMFE